MKEISENSIMEKIRNCEDTEQLRKTKVKVRSYDMHCVKKVTDDLYWIGGSDRRLALFENVYPIPREFPITHMFCWMKKRFC